MYSVHVIETFHDMSTPAVSVSCHRKSLWPTMYVIWTSSGVVTRHSTRNMHGHCEVTPSHEETAQKVACCNPRPQPIALLLDCIQVTVHLKTDSL